MAEIKIGVRTIGRHHPCFIIAEAGVNHNGDLKTALKLVETAVNAGADAIKFQTFKASKLAAGNATLAEYQAEAGIEADSQLEMLKNLQLSWDDHLAIVERCNELGITFLSTPFDGDSVDLLDKLGVEAYKVSSGDLTNIPLLESIAGMKKPVIISTGMSYMEEVDAAVRAVVNTGNEDVAILHCLSNYPARPDTVNLRAMQTIAGHFDHPVGYSDHTPGLEISIAAVAMGACIIEKHFTLDKNMPGPDHKASSEPGELKTLIKNIRSVESAMGDGEKRPADCEKEMIEVARRSLHWSNSLPAGQKVSTNDMIALRPGTGIPPASLSTFVGKRVARDVFKNQPVKDEDFAAASSR